MRHKSLVTLGTGLAFLTVLSAGTVGFAGPAFATPLPAVVSTNYSVIAANGLTFRLLSDGTATVTNATPAGPFVSIPEYAYGPQGSYRVTAIGNSAFAHIGTITSVTIPGSVRTIGDDAFAGDTMLSSVNIPSSLVSIGRRAFAQTALTSITFTAPPPVVFANFVQSGSTDYDEDVVTIHPAFNDASFPVANFTVTFLFGGSETKKATWNGYVVAPYVDPITKAAAAMVAAKAIAAAQLQAAADALAHAAAQAAAQLKAEVEAATQAVIAAQTRAAAIAAAADHAATVFALLGKAGGYSVLAGAALTAPGSKIAFGDVGTGAALTTDGDTEIGDSAVQNARDTADALLGLSRGYENLQGLTATPLAGADLGNQTLTAGVYHSDAAVAVTGDLTFDAKGDPNAVFIIQSDAAINTTAGTKMFLTGAAKASNIYWVSAAATTLGASSAFAGTIVSNAAITVGADSTVYGRLLSVTAAITLDADTININPTAGLFL